MAEEEKKKTTEVQTTKEKTVYHLKDVPGSLKDVIKSDAFNTAIVGFFTKEENRLRFVQSAVNALTKTPKLAECDKMSFFGSLMQLASFGLCPDGRNAHLIPYGTTCTLVIDYKGLVTMALRSEKVSKVEAFVVYSNDHFRLHNGEVEHTVDNPFGNRGDKIGYYAVCQFSDGTKKYEVMSLADVNAVRERSKAKNSGPWVTDFDEMAKKTVFKRLSKWLPVTPELVEAVAQDDKEYENEGTDFESRRSSRQTASEILGGGSKIPTAQSESPLEE